MKAIKSRSLWIDSYSGELSIGKVVRTTTETEAESEWPPMIRPIITLRRKRILIDIDTQKDLFLSTGKTCVPNHRRILANIRRVVAWARLKNVRMISTIRDCPVGDTHNCSCVAGTEGHRKVRYTIRNRHIAFAADGCTDLPRDLLRQYDQVIVAKRCVDPFDEPRADRILSEVKATEFILFGGTVEGALKATALGLMARRKFVTILIDAVGYHDRGAAEVALRQMEAKGAMLAETRSLLGSSHLHHIGVCTCSMCQGDMPLAPLELTV
jgi:nicotinamidase-related amidase